MVNFTCEQVKEHIYRLKGVGDVCMYYIKGDTSGILVDTGYGVGDLRNFVEKTFQQPYIVLITHGHADHAPGIGQWDKVYMSHKDIDLYRQRSGIELRKQMLTRSIHVEEVENEFIPNFTGEFLNLEDRMVFDLGNLHVETISAPGHTQGMMVLLVKEERTALFGDACGVFTFLFRPECSTVEQYQKTLLKLQALDGQYDTIYRQHGTFTSSKSLIQDNIDAASHILAGTDDRQPWKYMEYDVYIAKEVDWNTGKRKDGREGNIVYSDAFIR